MNETSELLRLLLSYANLTDNKSGSTANDFNARTNFVLDFVWWKLVLCVFPLTTIFGNSLVIMAVAKERKLRTVTNYFIVSLAVADLLVGTLVMPLAIYSEILDGFWNLSTFICDIWVTLDVMLCTASILNLVAISMDRFLAVVKPIKYTRQKHSSRVPVTLLVCWVISFAIALPILLGANLRRDKTRDPEMCLLFNSYYIIFSSMGSFYLPTIIMSLLYLKIFSAIQRKAKRRMMMRQKARLLMGLPESSYQDQLTSSERKLSLSKIRKTAKRWKSFKKNRPFVKKSDSSQPLVQSSVHSNLSTFACKANGALPTLQMYNSTRPSRPLIPRSSVHYEMPILVHTSNEPEEAKGENKVSESSYTLHSILDAQNLRPIDDEEEDDENEVIVGKEMTSECFSNWVIPVTECSSFVATENHIDDAYFGCQTFHKPDEVLVNDLNLVVPPEELKNTAENHIQKIETKSHPAFDCQYLHKPDEVVINEITVSYVSSIDDIPKSDIGESTTANDNSDTPYTGRLSTDNCLSVRFQENHAKPRSSFIVTPVRYSQLDEYSLSDKEGKLPVVSKLVAFPLTRKSITKLTYDDRRSPSPPPTKRNLLPEANTESHSRSSNEADVNKTRISKFMCCRWRSAKYKSQLLNPAMMRERKAIKVLVVVLVAFLLCWTPFFTGNNVMAFYDLSTGVYPMPSMPPYLMPAFMWLGYANSLLNPIIYAIINEDFRRAFKRIVGVDKRFWT